jgi:hypothetical protein
MTKKLQVSKRDKWIQQGAPEQALDFLGNAVDSLNSIAVEKQIIFKGEDVMEENVAVVENTEVVTENTQPTEEVVAEPVVTETPSATTEPTPVDMMAVIQKGIADAIVTALKDYNSAVVAPLQAQIAEMSAKLNETEKGKPTIQKSFSQMENVFFGASDFMPAAAVAEMLKKEFGVSNSSEQVGDVVVENVEKLETIVKEKKVTTAGDPANVLAGF